jgi:type II secretory pathway predicted ATPase ExeA
MNSLPEPVLSEAAAGLQSFFDRVRTSNPFTDNRVNGPSADLVDVGTIHQQQFEQVVGLVREALQEQRGLGAVLWGEAGIGKSHLLARLARWADADKNACFVYLHNLQASPANLPRSLLRAVVRILTQGKASELADTTLFRLTNRLVAEAMHAEPGRAYSWEVAEAAYRRLMDRLGSEEPSRAAQVDRTTYEVFYRFYRSAYLARQGQEDETTARLALRWLCGDSLDAQEARQLGLPAGQDVWLALEDNQQIKQVLTALTRLTLSRKQVLLLCFDQVDNLDVEQAAALARFLEAVIDSAYSLLVVVAGVQATLFQWRGQRVIQDSAWDRLAQFEIALQRINTAQAKDLVAARLQRYLGAYTQLDPIRQRLQEDPLFPLGRRWVEEFLDNKIEVRPRDVFNWAREGWRREQAALQKMGGSQWLAGWGEPSIAVSQAALTEAELQQVIDEKVGQKLREQVALRKSQPHTLSPDADNLAGLVYTLLQQCKAAGQPAYPFDFERLEKPKAGNRLPYDLLLRQRPSAAAAETRTGLLFLATDNANSAAGALRRLAQEKEPPERVFLVTDERQPLTLAQAGRRYRDELMRRGLEHFRQLELTFDQVAELDALVAIPNQARAGDVEIDLPGGQSRKVSVEEVLQSLTRQGRYAQAAILRELFSTPVHEAVAEQMPPKTASISRETSASARVS